MLDTQPALHHLLPPQTHPSSLCEHTVPALQLLLWGNILSQRSERVVKCFVSKLSGLIIQQQNHQATDRQSVRQETQQPAGSYWESLDIRTLLKHSPPVPQRNLNCKLVRHPAGLEPELIQLLVTERLTQSLLKTKALSKTKCELLSVYVLWCESPKTDSVRTTLPADGASLPGFI